MITIYQGETLIIERAVTDTAGADADLTGAVAYLGVNDGTTTTQTECTITGSDVSVTLEDTSTVGLFDLEIRVWLNGETDTIMKDKLRILPSLLAEMPT